MSVQSIQHIYNIQHIKQQSSWNKATVLTAKFNIRSSALSTKHTAVHSIQNMYKAPVFMAQTCGSTLLTIYETAVSMA